MPTFEAEDRFRQEYLRLHARKRAAFLKARDDFLAWLAAKKKQPDLTPPAHLRLHFMDTCAADTHCLQAWEEAARSFRS